MHSSAQALGTLLSSLNYSGRPKSWRVPRTLRIVDGGNSPAKSSTRRFDRTDLKRRESADCAEQASIHNESPLEILVRFQLSRKLDGVDLNFL